MTRWNRDSYELLEHTEGALCTYVWSLDYPNSQFSFAVQETAGQAIEREAVLSRVLCHILVGMVPERGLPELRDTLAQIIVHYGDSAHAVFNGVQAQVISEPKAAKVFGTIESPAFSFDPEE